MTLTRWAILLPGEDRTLATLAVILLHIVGLVDVAGAVAVVVARVAVAVALVVVARVAVAIATTEYSDRFIDGNRLIGAFSNQGVQGLLLVDQLILLVQQVLLLVEKLLYHLGLLARWTLGISPRLVMLELHMSLQAWNRPERSWRIALQTFNFRLCHADHLRTPHVATG